MKKMKKRIIKSFDKMIVVLLGLLGMFAGCKSKSDCSCEPKTTFEPLYGVTPVYYVDCVVKGTVTNKTNSKPIANIQINEWSYTDAKGNYKVECYEEDPNQKNIIHLKLEDIDGEENGGHFKTKEIAIKLTDADLEKRKECAKRNQILVKTQNIKLEKKK